VEVTEITAAMEGNDRIQLESEWKAQLQTEFQQPYMQKLKNFLLTERHAGKTIYPRGAEIFNAFTHTPFSKVKVVILGQDPYHGPGQAHGLCFSVPPNVPPPPSLLNIYKELANDLGLPIPHTGNLLPWADRGVLLLNAVLTVERARAASHQGQGWETFTDRVIERLNHAKQHLVFILWGSYAQAKGAKIDRRKHLVIESPHPSPLSAHRGFFGSKPFSRTNQYLQVHGIEPIDFSLL
jgi:uracil-DNA glycosylase